VGHGDAAHYAAGAGTSRARAGGVNGCARDTHKVMPMTPEEEKRPRALLAGASSRWVLLLP